VGLASSRFLPFPLLPLFPPSFSHSLSQSLHPPLPLPSLSLLPPLSLLLPSLFSSALPLSLAPSLALALPLYSSTCLSQYLHPPLPLLSLPRPHSFSSPLFLSLSAPLSLPLCYYSLSLPPSLCLSPLCPSLLSSPQGSWKFCKR